ncbi:MAG: Coenzyme F420 hydrogenase/dehydrogenase, beta subunit C-terminal domain [Acidimicrobiales bacterium]
MPLEKPHWAHLYQEVVTSGLCTGCAGCIIACPYDVLGYDGPGGSYRPFHVEADGGFDDCTHGVKGCTLCTRACPRFRDWEVEADQLRFGRPREEAEVAGVAKDVLLARASDPRLNSAGQDGGLVSAILVHALEAGVIDAALVSYLEAAAVVGGEAGTGSGGGDGTGRGDGGSTWKALPGVARSAEDVVRAAGSRYTYSANPLAYREAIAGGAEKIGLVGMSCQASLPPVLASRRAGKAARRFALTIGLLCSKTFDDSIFEELFEARHGIPRSEIVKMNIKGVFQIWTTDGAYHEVPLKEAHGWTREGCKTCPDFAAEHADISAGGIGAFADWTLAIARTDLGQEIMAQMTERGAIETRPAQDDPGAIVLLDKLSRVSRRRWPETAVPAPRRMPQQLRRVGPGAGQAARGA